MYVHRYGGSIVGSWNLSWRLAAMLPLFLASKRMIYLTIQPYQIRHSYPVSEVGEGRISW